jgi:hypothetical protein
MIASDTEIGSDADRAGSGGDSSIEYLSESEDGDGDVSDDEVDLEVSTVCMLICTNP